MITAATFAIFLVVCHIFMWCVGRRPRLWTQVDYVWLGAAALGLISASGAARQTAAKSQETWDRIRFESDLEHARWWTRTSLQYFETSSVLTSEPKDEKEKTVAKELRAAAQFYRVAVDALQRDAGGEPWAALLNDGFISAAAVEPVVEQDLRHLRRILRTVDESHKAVVSTRGAMQSSETETAYVLLWPWLLSGALALRITKVSAELKGYTKERSEDCGGRTVCASQTSG